MSGEQTHEVGRDGSRRAKIWLDLTTRANVYWVNPEPFAVDKLEFDWADGTKFSFDLGGIMLGGEKNHQLFLAEVKNYSASADQGNHYHEYLAKCFRARITRPSLAENFLWITWTPFLVTQWSDLCSTKRLTESLIKERVRALGISDEKEAQEYLNNHTQELEDVAARLWTPIVLSEHQEKHLTLTKEHLALIRAEDTKAGVL